MTSAAIKELHAAWEKDGAMAFDDAPGTWKKAKTDDGAPSCCSAFWQGSSTRVYVRLHKRLRR